MGEFVTDDAEADFSPRRALAELSQMREAVGRSKRELRVLAVVFLLGAVRDVVFLLIILRSWGWL